WRGRREPATGGGAVPSRHRTNVTLGARVVASLRSAPRPPRDVERHILRRAALDLRATGPDNDVLERPRLATATLSRSQRNNVALAECPPSRTTFFRVSTRGLRWRRSPPANPPARRCARGA